LINSIILIVQAQKQRTRSINILKRLFKNVDCILTPGIPLFFYSCCFIIIFIKGGFPLIKSE